MSAKSKGMLSIESKNVFSILKRWLYAEQDIVFRELVSNAIDAVSKREEAGHAGEVEVILNEAERTLTIRDNGIGMSAVEVDRYINQIAFSGAEDFVRQNANASDAIIGHFGVGFYSAFMLADHVAIETLSAAPGEAPVRWDCTGDMAFAMEEGSRSQPGTDVLLYLPENSPWLQKPQLVQQAVQKYFAFAKTPVFFSTPGAAREQLNTPKPLWKEAPEHIDKAAMNQFYKETFADSSDPLFWFQFSSIDLGLRGILYFRNTKNGSDELDGTVKVYCRGVYIGENIEGLIPKYVGLQNGIIECDRLPLVVSRGGLRSGEEGEEGDIIALVNECLTQEVAIQFNELFTQRRAEYEALWPEINAFVKYGIMQDKTFASVMMRKVIFEDIYGAYHTIGEYTEGDSPRDTVLYASDKLDQAHYIEILRKLGQNALLFDHVIDQPLLFRYETVYSKLRFIRIDSSAVEVYHGQPQPGDEALEEALRQRLTEALGPRLGAIELRFTRMQSAEVSALIVNDEQSRRMADMMEIYGYLNPEDTAAKGKQAGSALLLNLASSMVQFLAAPQNEAAQALVANQLFDLALMTQQLLRPEDMESFVGRSERLLAAYIGGQGG